MNLLSTADTFCLHLQTHYALPHLYYANMLTVLLMQVLTTSRCTPHAPTTVKAMHIVHQSLSGVLLQPLTRACSDTSPCKGNLAEWTAPRCGTQTACPPAAMCLPELSPLELHVAPARKMFSLGATCLLSMPEPHLVHFAQAQPKSPSSAPLSDQAVAEGLYHICHRSHIPLGHHQLQLWVVQTQQCLLLSLVT